MFGGPIYFLFYQLLFRDDPCAAHSLNEVVGGSGRIGSQFMRLNKRHGFAVPRGVSPGSISEAGAIWVCVPGHQWEEIYEKTILDRRGDLVLIGNGIWSPKHADVTVVLPHYAIPVVGGTPITSEQSPPTYMYGKHATTVQKMLQEDNILNTIIVSSQEEWNVKAAEKLLWASCMWLLCHGVASNPITVSDVHRSYSSILEQLVEELWMPFASLVHPKIPSRDAVLAYMCEYSMSIPDAIPSKSLGMEEFLGRNKLFLRSDQVLHPQLLEHVAGIDVTTWRPTGSSPSTENKALHLPYLGLIVHGTPKKRPPRYSNSLRVVIIGAGIVGSSIASNLAGQANVTVVDARSCDQFGNATEASWAWINANEKRPYFYQHLNSLGMLAWKRHALLRHVVDWKGSLVRYEYVPEKESFATGGYFAGPIGPLHPESWRKIEPFSNFPPTAETIYHFPNEGCVDPVEATKLLRRDAQEKGAKFLWNTEISSFQKFNEGHHLVTAEPSRSAVQVQLVADFVIVAAGKETATLLHIPVTHSPGTITFGETIENGVLSTILVDTVAKSHVLQRRCGALVAGGGELERGGATVHGVQHTSKETNAKPVSSLTPLWNRSRHCVQSVRPIPKDGLPVVGKTKTGIYAAAMHSAITLGPLMGELIAAEVLHCVDLDILEPYRPTRFDSEPK